ncbi:MAG: phosphotransferase [Egibacteraceae bacterium]
MTLVDPDLPSLDLALDPEHVRERFLVEWPGRGRPPVDISGCVRRDTKYTPGIRLVAAYELEVRLPDQPDALTFGVVEATPTGLEHRLARDDLRLPALASLTQPGVVRSRCEALLGSIEACRVTPVRYKPAARCVLRVDLVNGRGPEVFFAKCIADGGARYARTLQALAALNGPELPEFVTPLAFWPDWGTLLQPGVGGTELHALVFDPAIPLPLRTRAMRDAGRRVAGLHAAASVFGPPRTLADDVEDLATYTATIAQFDDALAARFSAATAVLERAPVSAEFVPSHGALRTDAFLLSEGLRPVLIDLDSFCWAEPARDLGNLLAYLDWRAIRRSAESEGLRAAQAFLDGYGTLLPLPEGDRLALCHAASLLKITGRRYRSLNIDEWPLVPRLLDRATVLLDGCQAA